MRADFGESRIVPLNPSGREGAPRLNMAVAARLLADVENALDRDVGAARSALCELAMLLQELGQPVAAAAAPPAPALHAPAVKAHRGGLTSWQFRAVVAYIDARLADPVQVSDLAVIAHLSYGYFHKAFKATTGNTPHGFIVQRRLDHAKALMLTTRDPLSQIAYACGLSDQAHLSRLFRRHVGDTPLNWRRTFCEAA